MFLVFTLLPALIAVIALVTASKLKARLVHLEMRVRDLERSAPSALETEEAPEISPMPPLSESQIRPSSAKAPPATPEQSPSPAPAAVMAAAPIPAPARNFEEQLGTRWAVWIGGLALALGGIFLVRFSIEQGLLGPGARIASGLLFAVAMIAAGEWMRRREVSFQVGAFPSAHIPSVLTTVGTLTAFGTVYSAHALYGLIGAGTAFVLLGLISFLTIMAALVHGPALAGLGLAATLVSPLLVSSDTPRLWPVVLYLAFAVASANALARLRLWRWLATAATAGALLWTLLMLMGPLRVTGIAPVMAHILVQLALASVFLVASPYRWTTDGEAEPDPWASSLLFAFAGVTLMVLTAQSWTDQVQPLFAAAVAALLLLLSLRFIPVAAASAAALLVGLGTLLFWPLAAQVAGEPITVLPDLAGRSPRPASVEAFLTFALGIVGAGGLCLQRVGRSEHLPLPLAAWLLAVGTGGPLAVLVLSYWRVTAFDPSLSFALAAGLLAMAFAGATHRLMTGGARTETARMAVGAAACGALAALALGLTFALDRGMLTVAFALMGLGTAWVAHRLDLPALRYGVGAVGLLVLGRLIWSPSIVSGSPGDWPILNWLLWGYGVPAVSFWLAARVLERNGRDLVVRMAESLAIAFAALLVFFEIRHALHGDIAYARSSHLEAGLMTLSALLFTIVMVRLHERRRDGLYDAAVNVFSALSIGTAGVGLLIHYNPLLTSEPVIGGALFNSLLPAYLMPAAAAGALAVVARRVRPRGFVWGMAGFALVLHLAYLVMAIRRLFGEPLIGLWRPTGEWEQWSYSLALIACGLVVLALGILRPSRFLRLASLAYLGLAVFKVFIFDLANLEGVMRALSFIGLGATLIGIALVYQRVLDRRPEPAGLA